MDPHAFRRDLDRIPSALVDLAHLDGSEFDGERNGQLAGLMKSLSSERGRILLIGMGSSYSAAAVVAARLRAAGFDAVAELASGVAEGVGWAPDPATLVIGISATGGSTETLDALDVHVGRVGPERVLAVTNVADSPITERAAHVLEMHAGVEEGGVACRTYRHTIAVLLALAERLASDWSTSPSISAPDTAIAVRRAAAATEYLLDRSDAWLPDVLAALDSPDGTWVLAPAARLASAHQAALMIREGPRRRADACETGDWSHIDVYLTKTLDYRALVYTGSRYDAAAADWMTRRSSTVVAVGGSFPDARHEVRYSGDDQPDVALLTEVLVAELVAATWWADTATSATTP